jgi:signal transduction histidine kinase
LPAARLRDAILNILLNACEACPEGGTISLLAEADAQVATIEIADSGSGLPPHLKEYLERPEAGAAPLDRRSGLGLWMVKRLSQELGGSIHAPERPGGGALIRLALPFDSKELKHVA